jgi:hypothetical protein
VGRLNPSQPQVQSLLATLIQISSLRLPLNRNSHPCPTDLRSVSHKAFLLRTQLPHNLPKTGHPYHLEAQVTLRLSTSPPHLLPVKLQATPLATQIPRKPLQEVASKVSTEVFSTYLLQSKTTRTCPQLVLAIWVHLPHQIRFLAQTRPTILNLLAFWGRVLRARLLAVVFLGKITPSHLCSANNSLSQHRLPLPPHLKLQRCLVVPVGQAMPCRLPLMESYALMRRKLPFLACPRNQTLNSVPVSRQPQGPPILATQLPRANHSLLSVRRPRRKCSNPSPLRQPRPAAHPCSVGFRNPRSNPLRQPTQERKKLQPHRRPDLLPRLQDPICFR